MSKVFSITASWIFVLIMISPAAMIMAEDPSSTRDQAIREAQPAMAAGGDVAPRPEFRLFERTPAPPASAEGQTKAGAAYGIVSTAATAGAKFMCVGGSGVAYLGFGDYGINAQGSTAGGYFSDLASSGYAYVGYSCTGIQSYGSAMGGYFKDSDNSGYSNVGEGDYGIKSYGNTAGGLFSDLDGSGYAYVGYGGYGIDARGNTVGGYFKDLNSSGYAYVGWGDTGIDARGTTVGGYFSDLNSSGYAWVGHGDTGIASYGSTMGGYFKDSNNSGYSNVGEGNYGIRSYGTHAGGYFKDSDNSGYAYVGNGDYGIQAWGNTGGGYFKDYDDSGYARVGYGNYGIQGYGNLMGASFGDINGSALAYVAYGDQGVYAQGNVMGGQFNCSTTSSYANVGYSTYKIQGTGTVSFVQNHPFDRDSVIVYAAPEGDEVATYTRGTARLDDGEARVPLGETFKWVTNPDIGLTVFLTPVSDWCDLYVAEQATESIVVRSRGGSDCSFNYMVYGLRIGFEESSVVQEKEQEAYIPSMTDHRQLYERRSDLKSFNSLERFKGMRSAVGQKEELDLSRANALRDAIIEFDPTVHELPRPPIFNEMTGEDTTGGDEGHKEEVQRRERVTAARADHDIRLAPDHPGLSAAIPMDAEGNVYATSFRPSSQDLASLLEVSEAVEPGDVLVIDRTEPGMMRRASEAADTGVVGVVAASAGVVLGMESPSRMPVERHVDRPDGEPADHEPAAGDPALRAPVAFSGVVRCKVDAGYGSVWPGDLLVTSPTPGHAMRDEMPLPGTVLGKALEALEEGTGTIRVLVMLR